MTTRVENVVYTVDPDSPAAVRYRAIPSDCSGAASSLRDARVSYRAGLIDRLGVGRPDLPPVTEHVEALVHGMWVREKVGAVHRDHYADRMFLQAVLARGEAQDGLRAHVKHAAHIGADPVVVLMEADESVGTVFDQMTPEDAVVVAYSSPDDVVGWAALYGESVVGAAAGAVSDISRATRVADLAGGQSVRVSSELLAVLDQAC